jgi:hypothetical protein
MKLRDLFEWQETLGSALRSNCADYLKAPGAHAGFLFRGMRVNHFAQYHEDNETGLKWTILQTRKNRQPSDTPDEFHELANEFLLQKFGWKPRTDGVFATSSHTEANGYGMQHVFFPIGPVDYIWSPHAKDLYVNVYHDIIARGPNSALDDDEQHKIFLKALEDAKYQDFGLSYAIEKGHEIMFNCDHYLVVRCGTNEKDEVLEKLAELTGISA